MSNRFLHAIAIPEDVLERSRGGQSQRVASQGALGSDVPAVESVSPDAGEQQIRGILAGPGAKLTADELEELFGASGVEVVPYFGDEPDPERDGYYALTDITPTRPAAQQPGIQQFDGKLTVRGTRRSHRRSLSTNATSVNNPFGSGSAVEVGIPARATDIQWFDDGDTQEAEPTTVQRTVEGEHDPIDIYDATEPSFSSPTLVYDVEYRHEWPVDVRIWDDRDEDKVQTTEETGDEIGTATVGDSTVGSATQVVAWQRVYRTDHDVVGSLVAETDRLRVRLAEDRGRLEAYRWNDDDANYDRVQLGVSDWRFERADIHYVGLEAVDAQLTFSDGSSTHRLDASFKRGYDDVLFANPPNAGSVPSALTDRLSPIADDSDQDPAATAGIVVKEDLGD